MPGLDVRRVTKDFTGHRAVGDVSISVAPGELLVLLGPSGCGKSTLLRMLAGLEAPTLGSIHIGAKDVTRLEPRDRNVAMVFQNYALYPHLTVFENIAFPLRSRRGVPGREVEARVRRAAALVGIEALLSRRPRQMSGGERQRTALARAMVREPDVFLLDEPLSNLDAKLRNDAREEIREFQRRAGVTTVYVTHDQIEAMALGDRIAVMSSGRLRQLATPREIYGRPADTFVATFIGTPPMNLLRQSDGTLVGVRPEELLAAGEAGTERDRFLLDVRVRRIEFLGGEWLLHGVREGDGAQPDRITVRSPVQAPPNVNEGEVWRLTAPAEALRRFAVDGTAAG